MTAPVLRTLARLSATGQPRRTQLDLTKAAGLVWLGDHPAATTVALQQDVSLWRPRKQQANEVNRLAAFDALHREDRLLRLGWAFLCGPAEIDGTRRRLCLPLLSRPIRLERRSGDRYTFHPAGDLSLYPLLTDWSTAADLEVEPGQGRPAVEWIQAVLDASSLGPVPIVEPDQHPAVLARGEKLVLVAGAGRHAGEPPGKLGPRDVALHLDGHGRGCRHRVRRAVPAGRRAGRRRWRAGGAAAAEPEPAGRGPVRPHRGGDRDRWPTGQWQNAHARRAGPGLGGGRPVGAAGQPHPQRGRGHRLGAARGGRAGPHPVRGLGAAPGDGPGVG